MDKGLAVRKLEGQLQKVRDLMSWLRGRQEEITRQILTLLKEVTAK